jgi:hypothetical protein
MRSGRGSFNPIKRFNYILLYPYNKTKIRCYSSFGFFNSTIDYPHASMLGLQDGLFGNSSLKISYGFWFDFNFQNNTS